MIVVLSSCVPTCFSSTCLAFLALLYHKSLLESQMVWEITLFSEPYLNGLLSDWKVSELRLSLILCYELLFCWQLDTKSASTVLYLLLETPWQPLTSAGSYVTLRWHQWRHYTPWCWTTRRMSFWELQWLHPCWGHNSLSNSLIALKLCLLHVPHPAVNM